MEKRCISTPPICLSPSVKETSYFRESAMKTFPQKCMCTAETAISMRIKPYMERGNSAILFI
jgi:hypothetical protein